jgi:hypothetical protein
MEARSGRLNMAGREGARAPAMRRGYCNRVCRRLRWRPATRQWCK